MSRTDPPLDARALLEDSRWLAALARRLLQDAATADDVVQETWARYVQNPPREARSTRSWLARVLRNLVADRFRDEDRRRRREHSAARSEQDASTPEKALERAELRREVVEGVLELDEPYRTTVILRFFEDESPRTIANRQGLSVHTVNTRLRRAIEALRARLDRRHGGLRVWALLIAPLAFSRPGAVAAASVGASAAATTTGTGMLIGGLAMSLKNVQVAVITVVLLVTGGIVWYLVSGRSERPELPTRSSAVGASEVRAVVKEAASPATRDERAPPELPSVAVVTVPSVPPALAGRITSEDGAPVADAEVVALPTEGWERLLLIDSRATGSSGTELQQILRRAAEVAKELPRRRSDDTGEYRFEALDDGGYRLFVRHAVHLTRDAGTVVIARGEPARHDIELSSGSLIRGIVIDAAGSPVTGAEIEAVASSERAVFGKEKSATLTRALRSGDFLIVPTPSTSNAAGIWELRSLEARPYDLAARKRGFRATRRFDVFAGSGETVELILESGYSFRGRLVDPQGRAIAAAAVRLVPRPRDLPRAVEIGMPLDQHMIPLDHDLQGRAQREVESGEDGSFEFLGLSKREFDLRIEADGFPGYSRRVRVSADTDLGDVLLDPGSRITGVVVDPWDQPVTDAYVWVEEAPADGIVGWGTRKWQPEVLTAAHVRADGSFTLEALPKGSFIVRAVSPNLAPNLVGNVAAGSTDVVIRLAPGKTVGGRVVDGSTGAPIEGAAVALAASHDFVAVYEKEVVSRADGSFEIRGVPDRTRGLLVSHPEYTRQPQRVYSADSEKPNIVKLFPTLEVTGRVVDVNGQPVGGAAVSLVGAMRGSAASTPRSRSRADGGFTISIPGDFQSSYSIALHASQPEAGAGRLGPLDLGADLKDVRVVLEPGVSVTGRVVDLRGEPVPQALVEFVMTEGGDRERRAISRADGSFEIPGVESGSYRCRLRAQGLAPRVEDLVIENSKTELEFVLATGRELVGTVRDDSGAPVTGAVVFAITTQEGDDRKKTKNSYARRQRSENGQAIDTAWTDDAGDFLFAALPEEDVTLFVRAPGCVASDLHVARRNAREHDFVLERYSRMRGTVVDKTTGRPISGFKVWVNLQENMEGMGGTGMILPREYGTPDGSFQLDPIIPGDYFAVVSSPGFVVHGATFTLLPGEDKVFEIALERGATVRGVVRDALDGTPVQGAQISLRDRSRVAWTNRIMSGLSAKTTLDGSFEIAGVKDGRFAVYLRHSDYTPVEERIRVEVVEGSAEPLELAMFPAGELIVSFSRQPNARRPFESIVSLYRPGEEEPAKRAHLGVMSTSAGETARVTSIPPGKYDVVLEEHFFKRVMKGGERIDYDKDVDKVETQLGTVDIEAGATAEISAAP